MRILSIGNSFSRDAQRYFYRLARANGTWVKSANLYIGGCSLQTHHTNITEDNKAYLFELNGESSSLYVTIKEALLSDKWDYVTLQQASYDSPYYDRYQPYINELAIYVREHAPTAKILIHQTWAYEKDSERLCTELGFETPEDMTNEIINAYDKASKDIKADGIIPCGEVFMTSLNNGVKKIHRDTYHADLGIGRYALALTWYSYLTGADPKKVSFDDFDTEVSKKEIKIVKKTVKDILQK